MYKTGADKTSARRAVQLMYNYGLTLEQYIELAIKQKNRCAICGHKETAARRARTFPLSVDHSHKSRRVRGLLCQSCNLALGKFKDSPRILRAALNYLKRAPSNYSTKRVKRIKSN